MTSLKSSDGDTIQEATHHHHIFDDNPLAHVNTGESERLPAFSGVLQPGLYRPPPKATPNAAPLGLFGFAATTFVLSLVNLHTRDISKPDIVIGGAFAYGGFIQLCAGMWEFAFGNTFGGTVLSSYGGFWISLAIILTPGGFEIAEAYPDSNDFNSAFGLFLFSWFIFTFMIWTLTLKSTVFFSFLFFSVWWSYLMLGTAYMFPSDGAPNLIMQKAGGGFGVLAAFTAWYCGFAGLADRSNSFFVVPVWHFPWSEKGRELRREKSESLKNGEDSV